LAVLAEVCLHSLAVAGSWQVRVQLRTAQLALGIEREAVGLAERKLPRAQQ
jgi:hypothetical protein